jgi:glycosyltransferase involved in cell wall biosynthesis
MNNLRVAFLVGSLGLGGAEKQLVYMARALQQSGARVRIYCLTEGEYYESILKNNNLPTLWIGKIQSPVGRLLNLAAKLYNFRPHIIQSIHFYANLYATLVAPLYKALGIGSLRSDAFNEVNSNGFWGMRLLKSPHAIISNSNTAKRNAISLGAREDRIFVLPNSIDLDNFDREYASSSLVSLPFKKNISQINAVVIGNLVPEKRVDLFLRALQKARKRTPILRGFIIGEGGEKNHLERMASDLRLFPDSVSFIGRNDNIPAILSQTDIFVLSSDTEGLPNVILEAMAARLPVIATPAGDASIVVEHEVTGYVAPFNDIDAIAAYMVNLSTKSILREKLGQAGRMKVQKEYSYDLLENRLLDIYKSIAIKMQNYQILKIL